MWKTLLKFPWLLNCHQGYMCFRIWEHWERFWSCCVVYPPTLWTFLTYCWKQMPRAFPSTALLNANLSCSVHSTLTPFREDSKNFTVFFPIFFFLLCCSLETPDQIWGILKSSCNFFSLRSHRPERLSIQCHKTVKYNLLLN